MKFGYALLAALFIVGCSSGGDSASGTTTTGNGTVSEGPKPLVVLSQANSQDPWRKVFDADTKAEADKHKDHFDFEMQDAGGDASKQNNIIDTFVIKSPKVLLVSPTEVSVASSIEKAYDAGVKVILLDRAIEGEKWNAWIGGDNVDIGRQAGKHIAERLNGKGTVLMIQGIAQATPTKDRAGGFMEVMKDYPNITVIQGNDCGYNRDKARSYMETVLQKDQVIDCVYAHNDEMAIGARLAWDASMPKTAKAPMFVGIDGCQLEVINMIKEGLLDATFKYPTPGAKGVEMASEMLKGTDPGKNHKLTLPTTKVTKDTADQYMKDNPNLAK
jgi:ribose transport system substrate-binding protein